MYKKQFNSKCSLPLVSDMIAFRSRRYMGLLDPSVMVQTWLKRFCSDVSDVE